MARQARWWTGVILGVGIALGGYGQAWAFSIEAFASDKNAFRIGVNAERGPEIALKRWQPTAAYLTAHLPGYRFELVPYDHAGFRAAVQAGEVDFALTNPGMYVEFESRHRFQRLVTLKNLSLGLPTVAFGSVFFTRAERHDLTDFPDLAGKRFMAVTPSGFGGWGLGLREMLDAGFDPKRKLDKLLFGGTHDDVVKEVLAGRVDAGLVRTDTLERMAAEGKIDLKQVRVIHENLDEKGGYPFLLSTRLYPEWPLSAAPHVPLSVRERVVIELLEISPDSPAAQAGLYAGWTVPLNYQPIHEVLRLLRAPPYENYGQFTWREVLAAYWDVIVLSLLLTGVLFVAALHFRRLNRTLTATQQELAGRNATLEAAQAQLNAELEVARAMQLSILPDPFPQHRHYQGAALMVPARQMGGDFFDYFHLEPHRLGVVIGDVSGKGVPAALFMAVSRTFLQMAAQKHFSPGECLARVNDLLCAENPMELFVTAFYGILDLESGVLHYANGGHNPPYLLTPAGGVRRLDGGRGTALGVMPGLTYQEASLPLAHGETLFMYTDGVTEAFNPAGEEFAGARLEGCLRQGAGTPVRRLVEGIFQSVTAFSAGLEQSDDITCLAVHYARGAG